MADRQPAHDFDFWIGEWDVFGPQGKQVGTNSITRLLDADTGALAEHWRSGTEVEGRSLNAYDADRGCWHQTWMDSGGGVLLLDGGLRDGAMVLEGRSEGARQRITWTQEGADVRQLWETSTGDGATWSVAFDGRYVRRS